MQKRTTATTEEKARVGEVEFFITAATVYEKDAPSCSVCYGCYSICMDTARSKPRRRLKHKIRMTRRNKKAMTRRGDTHTGKEDRRGKAHIHTET